MRPPLLTATALTAVVACSDAFQPTVENVIGSYDARTFTIIANDETTDLLKAGAVFTINFGPRGSTSGYLYIPAIGTSPEVIEDIDGTWTLDHGLILVEQTGGTFLQNMGFFAIERGELFASRTAPPSTRVRATLAKS